MSLCSVSIHVNRLQLRFGRPVLIVTLLLIQTKTRRLVLFDGVFCVVDVEELEVVHTENNEAVVVDIFFASSTKSQQRLKVRSVFSLLQSSLNSRCLTYVWVKSETTFCPVSVTF